MEQVEKNQEQEFEHYMRVPYEHTKITFKNAVISRSALFALGKVYSFSRVQGNETARCRSKVSEFSDDINVSERTVSRSLRALEDADLIARGKNSTYRYTGDPVGKGYIRTDFFLFSTVFNIRAHGTSTHPIPATSRRLTPSEVLIFSLIQTHCRNKKNGGKSTISNRAIAKTLNIAPATVARAIDALIHADLIHRTDKSVNAYNRTVYTLDGKILRRLEKQYRKTLHGQKITYVPKAVAEADARADRERFYALAQDKERRRVDAIKESLCADPAYNEAFVSKRRLQRPLAQAEVKGDTARASVLQAQDARYEKTMNERMIALGFDLDALKPKYRCLRCHDTGDGGCDCWKR